MGLNNLSKDPIYLSVNNGKFVQRVAPDYKGATRRVNALDKTVYEIYHDSLTARLLNIKTDKTGEYGHQWKLVLVDDGQIYVVNLLCNSYYAYTFICALPNINLTDKFTLSPSYEEKDGKTTMAIWVYQNGSSVKWKYTAAHLNGLPPLKQKKGRGKDKDKIKYDNTERMAFFQNMIDTEILPKLPKYKNKQEAENYEGENV